ncbi:MAG: MogA/MoaB family molybdenum cofactor biosynthesis protein [Desulfurococcaceae archaeon]
MNNLVFHIIVVSDSIHSGERKDTSGDKALEILVKNGYKVSGKTIIPNNYREIIRVIRKLYDSNVLIFIGGTGPSPRDITIDVIEEIAWRKIPGFGEYFRLKSFEEIGYHGLLSRSELYILHDGRIVTVLPGSPKSVETGLRILLNIVEHLFEEIWRFDEPHSTR